MDESTPSESAEPERRTGNASQRRAGVGMVLAFALIPPVLGSVVASLALASPGRVPLVLIGGLFGAVIFFLVATPFGRRSNHMRITVYRRLAELAILVGLASVFSVLYTLVVHLLFGWQRPWAGELFTALFG